MNIFLQQQLLEQVTETKLLGVTLDQTMSWKTHLHKIASKMSRNVSLIRCNSKCMSIEIRKVVLQSLVLCHLDYCSSVWSNSDMKYLDKLQKVQDRAARVALGCPFRTNVDEIHGRLSWLKVNDRLKCSSLLTLHKIWTSHEPFCLFSQLQPTYSRHGFNTRQASTDGFSLPKPRTEALKKTFMYRAMSHWNRLAPCIRLIENHVVFKVNMKKYDGRVPGGFNSGKVFKFCGVG